MVEAGDDLDWVNSASDPQRQVGSKQDSACSGWGDSVEGSSKKKMKLSIIIQKEKWR